MLIHRYLTHYLNIAIVEFKVEKDLIEIDGMKRNRALPAMHRDEMMPDCIMKFDQSAIFNPSV